MKKSIFDILKNIYFLSLAFSVIIYVFPGSLIGYFLYGNLDIQPNLISNPFGTSINHLICFIWLTILALIISLKKKAMINNIYLIFFLSIILESLHILIPNRTFEYYDLFANVLGVLIGFLIYKIFKWLNIY